MFQIKTGDELNFLDEREAIESNTSHLVVGGALGARQMHLTPQHGRKSVCHSVSFHYTTSFLVSQQTEFGFPVPDDVSFGSRQRIMDEGELGSSWFMLPPHSNKYDYDLHL